jgi:hypothetical protein
MSSSNASGAKSKGKELEKEFEGGDYVGYGYVSAGRSDGAVHDR